MREGGRLGRISRTSYPSETGNLSTKSRFRTITNRSSVGLLLKTAILTFWFQFGKMDFLG